MTRAAREAQAPALWANVRRNARAGPERGVRWRPARDALWHVLERIGPADRVAVVGAGNADDLPLTRLADVAREVVLIDIDPHAARAARRREPRALRRRIEVVGHDITAGSADRVSRAAVRGDDPRPSRPLDLPLPGAPYDLVVGDLFYSQLLYPALLDGSVPERRRRRTLATHAPALTRAVVARLHASAPGRPVVHLHDPLGWWPGHGQPLVLEAILASAGRDGADAALALARRGAGPRESDPRAALAALAIPIAATALWRWPFAPGVDYLVCATVAHTPARRGDRGTAAPPDRGPPS